VIDITHRQHCCRGFILQEAKWTLRANRRWSRNADVPSGNTTPTALSQLLHYVGYPGLTYLTTNLYISILPCVLVTCRRGLDWWVDLLDTH
jgi:hypothetical protein